MTRAEKAAIFLSLHVAGSPVVLYNVWDAGSAKAIAEAGAKAIATGSESVAAAQGFEDGQNIPMDVALSTAMQIISATDLPTTIDFEGGYATSPAEITANVARLIETGAVGLNFEDRIVGGTGLYDVDTQVDRIKAVRAAAKNQPFVINARTDLFLQAGEDTDHATLVDEAIARAARYKEAGADCFFVPLLSDTGLIRRICDAVALPVNVMVLDQDADLQPLREAGVARISYGPAPYLAAYRAITDSARNVFKLS